MPASSVTCSSICVDQFETTERGATVAKISKYYETKRDCMYR